MPLVPGARDDPPAGEDRPAARARRPRRRHRQGEPWYTRWVQELRANYLELFDVPGQIGELEAPYATLAPGPAGEPLWQSDLYSVPKAAPRRHPAADGTAHR